MSDASMEQNWCKWPEHDWNRFVEKANKIIALEREVLWLKSELAKLTPPQADEMVEKVARAICFSRRGDPDKVLAGNNMYDDGSPETLVAIPNWKNYSNAARAASAAIMER